HGQLHVGAGRVDDRSAMALIDHQARVAARDLALARRELVAAIASFAAVGDPFAQWAPMFLFVGVLVWAYVLHHKRRSAMSAA
ncbi:MAG: hypothetical protein ACK4L7_01980, partial [Flavobacteriales bacterium]